MLIEFKGMFLFEWVKVWKLKNLLKLKVISLEVKMQ